MKIRQRIKLNDHLTRYFVEPGNFFIDRDSPALNGGYRYCLFESGAGSTISTNGRSYRVAAERGHSDTLKGALEIAESLIS